MSDFDPVALLTQQWKVLGHEGLGFTEIRIPQKGIQKFVRTEDEFVKTALAYCKGPVYVGINPRRIESGKAEDISALCSIVLDFDPVRPKDTASTDEQHDEAIKVASEFCHDHDGLLVSSGSGAHVYLPLTAIPITDFKTQGEMLHNFGKEMQERYSTSTIKVDSIFDLPRIIRCWGSRNTKSNRNCEFLSGTYSRRNFKLEDYKTVEPIPGQTNREQPRTTVNISTDERLKQSIETNENLRRILKKEKSFSDRSGADFALISELFKEGFKDQDIKKIVYQSNSWSAKDRSDVEQDKEIVRIYEKVKYDIPKKNGLAINDEDEYTKDLANRRMGIQTGFMRWDRMTAGLKPGRFYVEAGRPGEGKTTRLVQIAKNIAMSGRRVLYFPTECAKTVIYDKLVSAETGINCMKFSDGSFSSEDNEKIAPAIKKMLSLPIRVEENFSLKFSDIEKVVRNFSPDYVIVDFLNNMSYTDCNSPSELGANVISIKNLGKKYNIPITLACQLHRKLPNTEYSLSDLKGTGKLEEEGDIITFVHSVDLKPYPVHTKVIILKNKFGETGVMKNDFYRATCRFEEVQEWKSDVRPM